MPEIVITENRVGRTAHLKFSIRVNGVEISSHKAVVPLEKAKEVRLKWIQNSM